MLQKSENVKNGLSIDLALVFLKLDEFQCGLNYSAPGGIYFKNCKSTATFHPKESMSATFRPWHYVSQPLSSPQIQLFLTLRCLNGGEMKYRDCKPVLSFQPAFQFIVIAGTKRSMACIKSSLNRNKVFKF